MPIVRQYRHFKYEGFILASLIALGPIQQSQSAFAEATPAPRIDTIVVDTPSPQVDNDQNDDEDVEELLITGSRISRLGFNAKTPVTVLDSEFVQLRGFATAADPISQLPGFFLGSDIGGSTNNGSAGRGQQFAANLGQNFPNAFGLGTNRTLTLINGRRVISQNNPLATNTEDFRDRTRNFSRVFETQLSSVAPGQQVDLNTIPTALIDRLEVVYTGGTPAYGADAVAGTVNILLKDDFEGFEVLSQYGISEEGDAESERFQATYGQRLGKDRGNIAVSLEYANEEGLFIDDRPELIEGFNLCPRGVENTGNGEGPVTIFEFCEDARANVRAPNTGIVSRLGFGGRFTVENPPLILDLDGGIASLEETGLGELGTEGRSFSGTPTEGTRVTQNPFFTFTLEDNPNLSTVLITPQERFFAHTIGHYELTPSIRFNFEASYIHTQSEGEDIRPPVSVLRTGRNNFGGTGEFLINPAENPFVSEELRQGLIERGLFDPDNPQEQLLTLERSNVDIVGGRGRLRNFREQDIYRSVIGLEGTKEFGGRSIDWDASYVFGQSSSFLREQGIDNDRLILAVDAIRDPDTGNIVCRSQIDPDAFIPETATTADIDACIPLNIFGLNQFSSEARDYVFLENTSRARLRQHIGELNLQTDLFSVPAGEVSIALGYHYRRESGFIRPVQTLFTGVGAGVITTPTRGNTNTHDIYGEVIFPIVRNNKGLGDQNLIANFDIEGASRLSNHSNAGSDFSFTIGSRLNLNLPFIKDAITFRGQYAEAIRSPSTVELFAPTRRTRIQFTGDACAGRAAVGTTLPDDPDIIIEEPELITRPNPTVRSNCLSQINELIEAGSLPEDFSLEEFAAEMSATPIPTPVFSQGNPDLNNEQSRSYSAGFVFQPNYIPGLSFAADWTDIRLTDLIDSRLSIDECFFRPNLSSPACDLIERDPNTFQLLSAPFAPINTNDRRSFGGVTANLNYSFALEEISSNLPGNLSLQGIFFYNYKDRFTFIFNATDEVRSFDREERLSELGGGRRRYSINTTYNLDKFTGFIEWRHISGAGNSQTNIRERVSSTDLFNLTLQYQFFERLTARVIVNDVFDNRGDAPLNQANGIIVNPVGRNFIFSLSAKL